jgi:hypothetical protein
MAISNHHLAALVDVTAARDVIATNLLKGEGGKIALTHSGGYPGGTATFLRADGTFAEVSGGTLGAHAATHRPGGSDQLFNQSLNTTDNPQFVDVVVNRDLFVTRHAGITGNMAVNGGISEYARSVAQGVLITQAFNAANFFGTGPLVWTVSAANVTLNVYSLVGKQILWALRVTNSNLSGSAYAGVYAKLPGGLVGVLPDFNIGSVAYMNNGGVVVPAMALVQGDVLLLQPTSGGFLQPGTLTLYFTVSTWVA